MPARHERINHGKGKPSLYLWCDTAEDLAGYRTADRGDAVWQYGSLQTRAATVEAFTAGRATPAQREAFDAEAGRWRDATRKLRDALPSRRRKLRYREAGDVVDVGRYLSDRPDCWETLQRGRSMPAVVVGFNVCLSSGNEEADFIATVSKAAACCWALSEAGYAVRVVGCALTQNLTGTRYDWCGPAWVAKDWQAPLDVERLLSYGHPGVLRDFAFGLWEDEAGGKSPYGVAMQPGKVQARELGVDLFLGRSWVMGGTDAGSRLIQRTNMEGFFQG
jgi:hypothetical protein